MALIRVGIIGLSAKTAWETGAWAAIAHLPGLQQSSAYEITAITGRSKVSAEAAIQAHKLPSTVKIYTDAKELANDPNVDLVVVSTRVATHYENALPALQAGKDVLVEWPIGANLKEAEELTQLAATKGVRALPGLQARASPVTHKLKEIIKQGKIGNVISSSAVGLSGLPADTLYPLPDFYLDFASGGNEFTINFGHFLDSFTDVLGDFGDVLQASMKTQWPTATDTDGRVVPRTAPDHIAVQGILQGGAVASLAWRKPKGEPVDAAIHWTITGTDGELEVTSPSGLWQIFGLPSSSIRLRTNGASATEEIEYRTKGPVSELGVGAQNVALVYEALARGDTERYATFESGLKTHRLLDRIAQAAGWDHRAHGN